MQYSLFTHGTALEIETPDALAGSIKVGWGTQILFRAPVAENVEGLPVFPEVGPGSWFHMPLPSTLTTFGRRNPRLESVTLLFGVGLIAPVTQGLQACSSLAALAGL